MFFLAGLSASLILAVLVFGTFLPIGGGRYYLFVWPGERLVGISFALGFAGVGLVYVAVNALARATERAAAARSGRWLMPVVGSGLLCAGIIPAAPGVGAAAAPIAFFLYDLRWWWILIAGCFLVRNIDALFGGRFAGLVRAPGRWPPAVRLLALDAIVFLIVVAWAVATMPHLRFTGSLHGDEPKYIRYCETLYQGQGFSGSKALFDEVGLDAPLRLTRNAALLVGALGDETRALAADLRAFARQPGTFRWNRAEPRPNWFLIGKNGQGYQVHQPGLSFLLLPGYVVDRHLLGLSAGYQGEFPNDLFVTNLTMLVLAGVAGVALFRLLRRATGSDGWALAGACLALVTLPTTSLVFQIYPEIPAALLAMYAANIVIYHGAGARAAHASLAGAGASYLLWLHPRFLLLWLVLVLLGAYALRGRARGGFLLSAAVVAFMFCAFVYHITGSWLPTALYDADPESNAFVLSIIPFQSLANLLDRIWGVVPHAPALLLLPAAVVWLVRRSWFEAVAFMAMTLALVATTAAHGLGAAGATPGRHLVAVMPLMWWPLTLLAQRVVPSRSAIRALIVLAVLSLDAALAYNRDHTKAVGKLISATASGWRPNLAFPWLHGEVWERSTGNYATFVALLAFVAGLTIWLLMRRRGTPGGIFGTDSGPRPWALARHAGLPATIAVAAVLAIALTSGAGERTNSTFLSDETATLREAASRLVALDRCRVCFSSVRSRFDWTRLAPNSAVGVAMDAGVGGAGMVTFDVVVTHAPGESYADVPAFGRAWIDFGDGAHSRWFGVVDRAAVTHRYDRPGTYRAMVVLRLRDGRITSVDRRIRVEMAGGG